MCAGSCGVKAGCLQALLSQEEESRREGEKERRREGEKARKRKRNGVSEERIVDRAPVRTFSHCEPRTLLLLLLPVSATCSII